MTLVKGIGERDRELKIDIRGTNKMKQVRVKQSSEREIGNAVALKSSAVFDR